MKRRLLAQHLRHTRAESERKAVIETVQKCGGNKKEAARQLGIHLSTVYNKLAQVRCA